MGMRSQHVSIGPASTEGSRRLTVEREKPLGLTNVIPTGILSKFLQHQIKVAVSYEDACSQRVDGQSDNPTDCAA